MDFPKTAKKQPLVLKMQFLFGCLCCTSFPKLSEIRICHYTEEMGQETGRGGEMVLFPSILLAAFQQKERRCRRCRERVEMCGFSGDELPHLGRTPASPVRGSPAERDGAARRSGARLPRGLRHMGLPVGDSVSSGHRPRWEKCSGGACTGPEPD